MLWFNNCTVAGSFGWHLDEGIVGTLASRYDSGDAVGARAPRSKRPLRLADFSDSPQRMLVADIVVDAGKFCWVEEIHADVNV